MNITKRDMIKYTLLPGVWPRLTELFGKGFLHLPYLIAIVFRTVYILPAAHPYLNPKNFGHYSILQVLGAAAAEIKPGWRNADKIALFSSIVAGLVMLVIQFVLMIITVIVTSARAQEEAEKAKGLPTTYEGFFSTPNPSEDIAFRMMDMLFGVPGVFKSKEMENGPEAFHLALQALLQFYSFGLLLIGVFVLIYMTIAVVAETAQSGTPFGQRFNKAWTPIRVILFFALLIPITNGLNGAQYIVLLAAKGGSGLATNGWLTFNNTLQGTYLGERESLVAKPRPPDLTSVAAFVMLAKTCQMAVGGKMAGKKDVQAWVIVGNESEKLGSSTFQTITAKLKDKKGFLDIKVRFGEKADQHLYEPGKVFPYCGELSFYTSDISEPGAAAIQQSYFELVTMLWNGSGKPPGCGTPAGPPGCKAPSALERLGDDLTKYAKAFYDRFVKNDTDVELPPENFKQYWAALLENYMTGKGYTVGEGSTTYQEDETGGKIGEAVRIQAKDGKWDADQAILDLGWAGAGIWYNKIAQQNGALVTAVRNAPIPSLYPDSMEYASQKKQASSIFVTAEDRFNPALKDGGLVPPRVSGEMEVMLVLNKVYQYWQVKENLSSAPVGQMAMTDNIVIDAINLLFGTSGLFDMCTNKDIHPLAQLSAVGKGMIDAAIRGFATGAILGAGGSFLSILSPYLGQAGYGAASFMVTIAGVGLMIGFMLFYLVPFMPFLYFFFAVGNWLKGVFEAIIGAPLWALGHLRIDGEGMPGEAAAVGYFMILEVFLRPILIIFGLLASLIFFSAMVKVLNDIFYLLVTNMPGDAEAENFCFTDSVDSSNAARGPIDQFFYTIVYAIIVYMIGMSSFKMTDMIPRSIMRWLTDDVAAFGDQSGDAAEGLMQRVAMGGAGLGERLESGLSNAGGSLQGAVGEAVKKLFK